MAERKQIMKRKILMLVSILCLIFSIGTYANVIFGDSADEQTEKTTTELTATIEEVETLDTEEIWIYTNEYDTKFVISSGLSELIDLDDLQIDQTIYFRIENIWLYELYESIFLQIVSLETSEKEIFSLMDYNECIHKSVISANVAGGVAGTLFLLVFLYCLKLLKR